MSETTRDRSPASPSVFISYARQDTEVARNLAEKLQAAGVGVWWDAHIKLGENWAETIEAQLRSADYILILVTTAALQSKQVMANASPRAVREYGDRDVTVVPVLLEDVDMPPSLSGIQYLDFRDNQDRAVDALVSRLSSGAEIDFSAFSPQAFERLVGDLLLDLGFAVEVEPRVPDRGFDFRADVRVQDPFGAVVTERWLIDVKHRSSGRVDVATLSEFIGLAHSLGFAENTKLALITSGQLTSAGREVLKSAPLRVVEGVELKRILLTRHHLITRHMDRRLK